MRAPENGHVSSTKWPCKLHEFGDFSMNVVRKMENAGTFAEKSWSFVHWNSGNIARIPIDLIKSLTHR